MVIRRGTTPNITAESPVEESLIQEVKIVFSQCGNIVVTKKKTDCTFDGCMLMTKLSQEETFSFDCEKPAVIQARLLTKGNDVIGSDPITVDVLDCNDDEVLKCE